MEDRRELWAGLAWRALAACPFAVAAAVLFARSAGCTNAAAWRLLGLMCVIVAAIIVGRGLAGVIAEPAGSLFYPTRVALPEPRRSIAEAQRAHGRYAEAIAAYEQVVEEFPGDLTSWAAMVEIALVHLRDRGRGDALARRALLALGDEGSRIELVRAHRRAAQRLRDATMAG